MGLYSMVRYLYNRSCSMSFIFERLGTGTKLAFSQDCLSEEPFSAFTRKRPTISNAKTLSQVQWKAYTFKSLKCFTDVVLIVSTIFLLKCQRQEEQEIHHHISTLLALTSAVFYFFATINELSQLPQPLIDQAISRASATLKTALGLLFYLLHPNHYLSQSFIVINSHPYRINQILGIAVILRIFSIFRFAIELTRFSGLRVRRVLDIYGVDNKSRVRYALKCLLKENRLQNLGFILILSIVITSFLNLNIMSLLGHQGDFLTQFYQTVITMTTVGFGDALQESVFERANAIVMVVLGSIISSLLTLTVLNNFKLTEPQTKAYYLFNRLALEDKRAAELKMRVVDACQYYATGKKRQYISSHLHLRRINQPKKGLQQIQGDKLTVSLGRRYEELMSNLKKLVEKQLIINQLMIFYCQRRTKVELELADQDCPQKAAPRSKCRVEDSARIGRHLRNILK